MKSLRFAAFLAAGLAALAALAPLPANAAATAVNDYIVLCSPEAAAANVGPRRVTNPGTSGGSYVLNGQGCAAFSTYNSDAAYFQSQGFTPGPNLFSLVQTGITASTTATTSTITLPANAVIIAIVLQESAGNAVTGGIDIGNATSATAYASAVALGANALVAVADSALTRVYPATTPTVSEKVLTACHTSCNSASVNITILYSLF
jgi:hypothetical protein